MHKGLYLVHDGGWRGFDAWLLVWEGKLLQQVHIGQRILQGHVGCHGDTGSLTKQPNLKQEEEDQELYHHHSEGAALSTLTQCLSVTLSIKHWHLKREMS